MPKPSHGERGEDSLLFSVLPCHGGRKEVARVSIKIFFFNKNIFFFNLKYAFFLLLSIVLS